MTNELRRRWKKGIRPMRGLFLLGAILYAEKATMATDLPTREPEGEFVRIDGQTFGPIFFTPDGQHLVGIGTDRRTKEGIVNFWDIRTRKLVRTVTHPDSVAAAVFTPDGKRLVTSCWDKKMRIFKDPDWQPEHVFDHDPPNQFAQDLAMFPDGKRFISGNSGYRGPRIWDLDKRTAIPLGGAREQINYLAVSEDGKRFAVAYSAPITEIWDTDKLKIAGRLEKEGQVFVSVAWSPDGKHIATGVIGPLAVILWDGATFKEGVTCPGVSDDPLALSFTPDSKLLVCTMGAERDIPAKVCIWEVKTGNLVYSFSPWKHGCMRHALSPDGRWLVTRGVDETLRLWDFQKIRSEIGK